MRKFILIFICAMFICCAFSSVQAKTTKKKVSTKHKIEFTTKDKFILTGDLYLADNVSNKPLVVCLHSFSLNSSVWADLASNLRLKGYNVLAMDLRGHGRSVYNEQLKLKSRFNFTQKTWQKLPKDVIESINYVKAHYPKINTDDTIIIGADIGASAGTIAALSFKKMPQKIIMISPMLDFKGLRMPIKTAKFYDTKIMMLLVKTDRVFLNFYTKTPIITKRYPIGGPGNQLIKANPDSKNDIINFIIN